MVKKTAKTGPKSEVFAPPRVKKEVHRVKRRCAAGAQIISSKNGLMRRFWWRYGVLQLFERRNESLKVKRPVDEAFDWIQTVCDDRARSMNNSELDLPLISNRAIKEFNRLSEWAALIDQEPPQLGGLVLYAAPPSKRRKNRPDGVQNGLLVGMYKLNSAGSTQSYRAVIVPFDPRLSRLPRDVVVVDLELAVFHGMDAWRNESAKADADRQQELASRSKSFRPNKMLPHGVQQSGWWTVLQIMLSMPETADQGMKLLHFEERGKHGLSDEEIEANRVNS
jgi:hypothetical protein